jgi:hypothetical protein
MVVSSGSAPTAPSVKLPPQRPAKSRETFGRSKPIRKKLNETGTLVSEKVHVREIVVIPGSFGLSGRASAFGLVACRWRAAPI